MDDFKKLIENGKDVIEEAKDYVECGMGNPKLKYMIDFDTDCNTFIEFEYDGEQYGFPAWLFWGLAFAVLFLFICLCHISLKQ